MRQVFLELRAIGADNVVGGFGVAAVLPQRSGEPKCGDAVLLLCGHLWGSRS